ncbi:putative E3 ubiquitin-protein ligase hulA [Grifola frondosa]|uniref:HECT-type E3 ubiquitin transferase n=1 Tax=Grifola frondosa TaxID=5627 RepID=A0A1C7LWP0_GRIFR|nr:putative E3 ubiquitin-protein ligase hulA [Grifola frondosa]
MSPATTTWLKPADDDNSPLPSGWERDRDPKNRIYYIDHNTRTTTYQKPTDACGPLPAGWVRLHKENDDFIYFNSETRTITCVRPPLDPLPDGWEEGIIEESGRVYYYNRNTHETAWVRPNTGGPEYMNELLPDGWEMRITNDNKVYYVDHNTCTTTWEDPRAPLELSQAEREFRQKLQYFDCHLHHPSVPVTTIKLSMRPAYIYEDSFIGISKLSAEEIRGIVAGEDDNDGAGISQEFVYLLSKEVFKPTRHLFRYTSGDSLTQDIDPASGAHPELLNHFKFVGRCFALAVFHHRNIPGRLTSAFFKRMLNKELTLADLESVDPELHSRLSNILNGKTANNGTRTFTMRDERQGVRVTVELKPGGASIPVTDDNKAEYVRLVVEYHLRGRVQAQFDAFMSGFNDLIPSSAISIFNEVELERVVVAYIHCGILETANTTSSQRGFQIRAGQISLSYGPLTKAVRTVNKAYFDGRQN